MRQGNLLFQYPRGPRVFEVGDKILKCSYNDDHLEVEQKMVLHYLTDCPNKDLSVPKPSSINDIQKTYPCPFKCSKSFSFYFMDTHLINCPKNPSKGKAFDEIKCKCPIQLTCSEQKFGTIVAHVKICTYQKGLHRQTASSNYNCPFLGKSESHNSNSLPQFLTHVANCYGLRRRGYDVIKNYRQVDQLSCDIGAARMEEILQQQNLIKVTEDIVVRNKRLEELREKIKKKHRELKDLEKAVPELKKKVSQAENFRAQLESTLLESLIQK